MEHKQRIEEWLRLGIELGYSTTSEFKIPSSKDRIDCIWQTPTEFVAIEVECGGFGNQQFKNLIKILSLKKGLIPSRLIFDCELELTKEKITELVKRFEPLFLQNNCKVFVFNREAAIFDLVRFIQSSKLPLTCNNYYILANLEKFRCLVEEFEVCKKAGTHTFKTNLDYLRAYRLFIEDMLLYLKERGYLNFARSSDSKHIEISLNKEFKGSLMGVPIESILTCDYKNAQIIWDTR